MNEESQQQKKKESSPSFEQSSLRDAIYSIHCLNDVMELKEYGMNIIQVHIAGELRDVFSLRFFGYPFVHTIKVKENSCKFAETLVVEDCPALKTICFGENSFCAIQNENSTKSYADRKKLTNERRKAVFRNCGQLTSIYFNNGSFADFAGEFELKSYFCFSFLLDLDQLESLEFGGWNFLALSSCKFQSSLRI